MRRPAAIVLFLCLAAGAGLGLWRWFFPDPEQVLRRQFVQLARVASFEPNEPALARMAALQKLTTFFTREAHVTLNLQGYPKQTLNGREDILAALSYARTQLSSLSVGFVDINIRLDNHKKAALINLTLKGSIGGEKDPLVQQMNFVLKQIDGDWLIDRAETVPSLL